MSTSAGSAHPTVLGIESSCDETGVAVFRMGAGLLAEALHSQVAMHAAYGGVVPELASRDHVVRLVPLVRQALAQARLTVRDLDALAYTAGPGLAGALLVGASVGAALAFALGIPAIPIHHLEGHLLSPLLSTRPPSFPYIALLVSGGHTQLMRVEGLGRYTLLGETLDDAAGEAFDKTAQLLELGYPGGPALARVAESGTAGRFKLPRPMIGSGDLDFSFAGLKTAVLTRVRNRTLSDAEKADLAAEFQQAVVDVLVAKCVSAVVASGTRSLVVAGGVGANRRLRETLTDTAARQGFEVFFPEPQFCTDNGAMIAFAGACRLAQGAMPGDSSLEFAVHPRWDLSTITA